MTKVTSAARPSALHAAKRRSMRVVMGAALARARGDGRRGVGGRLRRSSCRGEVEHGLGTANGIAAYVNRGRYPYNFGMSISTIKAFGRSATRRLCDGAESRFAGLAIELAVARWRESERDAAVGLSYHDCLVKIGRASDDRSPSESWSIASEPDAYALAAEDCGCHVNRVTEIVNGVAASPPTRARRPVFRYTAAFEPCKSSPRSLRRRCATSAKRSRRSVEKAV